MPRLRPRRTGDGPHAGVLGQLPGILSWGGGGRDPSTGIAPTTRPKGAANTDTETRGRENGRRSEPGKDSKLILRGPSGSKVGSLLDSLSAK